MPSDSAVRVNGLGAGQEPVGVSASRLKECAIRPRFNGQLSPQDGGALRPAVGFDASQDQVHEARREVAGTSWPTKSGHCTNKPPEPQHGS